ncbi:hypothetical protein [Melghirimyces algeriensis]|uniref:hypothetical protein n=1 Tax=Melghirimyces algeriensis TaxID=910412 RepID=UPI00163DB782|nr:hypothetical protein [Melghirimyces algeriensis]
MSWKKWMVLMAISAMLFSSGCSLMVKQMADHSQKQFEKETEKVTKKEPEEDSSAEEEEVEIAPDIEAEEEPVDETKLEVSGITVFVDDQGWRQVNQATEQGVESIQFIPGNTSESDPSETLFVMTYKGVPTSALPQLAEGFKQEWLKDGHSGWDEISSKEGDILVKLGQGLGAEGFTRFFATDQGIFQIIYVSKHSMSEEDQTKWKSLLRQADRDQTTL